MMPSAAVTMRMVLDAAIDRLLMFEKSYEHLFFTANSFH